MPTRIAVSPLTGRVHQGRVNKAGNAFVGEKKDVTSDVLLAVIEKAQFHGGHFEIEGGDKKYLVVVTEIPPFPGAPLPAGDGYPQCDREDSYE